MEQDNNYGFKSYGFKKQYGIDDLLCEFAFIGNSQGDTSCSNLIDDYKNADGWMSFVFNGIDIDDQQAIDAEVERRKKHNQEYINKLKQEGRFGEYYDVTIHFKPLSQFESNNEQYTNAGIIFPTKKI